MHKQMHVLLFVDIDGTLVHHSLEQWFLKYLLKERIIRRSKLISDTLINIIRGTFIRWFQWKLVYLRDRYEDDVKIWIEECWMKMIKSALISQSIEFVDCLRKQGIHVVLLSGTFSSLAKPLMNHLGIEDAICAEPVIKNQRYTGGLYRPHPWGKNKVHYVSEWLFDRGYSWEGTLAMADQWSDRHLLARVSIPIAVYPGCRLRRLANKNKWALGTRSFCSGKDCDRIDPSNSRMIIIKADKRFKKYI